MAKSSMEHLEQREREFVYVIKYAFRILSEYDNTVAHRDITHALNVLTMALNDQELSAPMPDDPFGPYVVEYDSAEQDRTGARNEGP